ncbi:MAG TPA: hypothetical protein VJM08_12645 [Anaerolineales bacterium]|nr:hypothetical protein [Anaerolineales bacterium]
MNDELKQKLIAEINKSGFSHEIDIIQRLRAEELIVFPNLAYLDVEDKPHEIDAYVGFTNYDEEKSLDEVALNLIVECKSSSDKPWVFFDDSEDALAILGLVDRMVCFSDFEMKDTLTPLAGCMNTALRGHHYNDSTIPVARTHLEAFGKDSGKEIYQGITSLWYAIDYFKRLFAKSTHNRTPQNKRISFIHPVIIFKGVMVAARKNNDDFEIEEVPHVILRTIDCITDKELDFRVASKEIIVDVIRNDFLENYIQICRNDLRLCMAHIEQLFKAGWIVRDTNNVSSNT